MRLLILLSLVVGIMSGCSISKVELNQFKFGQLYMLESMLDEAVATECGNSEVMFDAKRWMDIAYGSLSSYVLYLDKGSEQHLRSTELLKQLYTDHHDCNSITSVLEQTRSVLLILGEE